MAQYTINSAYRSYFGMDVHARSVTVKGLDLKSGRTETKRFDGPPSAKDMIDWMRLNFAPPFYAAYESGCTGFHLCRELRALGADCDVIAVSSIARSGDDKLHKSDKRDAARLLSELVNPAAQYSAVWCPDAECEAVRNLARARHTAALDVKVAKQRAESLLLTHGIVWNERAESGNLKSTWTREYRAWLSRVDLGEPCAQKTLDFLIRCVDEAQARLKDISREALALADMPRWKPYVDALSAMKGIDVHTALLLAAEFGDFTRFASGRAVSKWAGLTPSESSTGDTVSHGRITKAGDVFVRGALIEGLAAASRMGASPKALRRGQAVSPSVLAICHKATRRMCARFHHLTHKAKIGSNKAKVALACEMVRWVWVVGCAVQLEQGAL